MAYIILFTYSEELNYLSSPDIITVNKQTRTGCVGLAEGMGSAKYAYKIWPQNFKGKEDLENSENLKGGHYHTI